MKLFKTRSERCEFKKRKVRRGLIQSYIEKLKMKVKKGRGPENQRTFIENIKKRKKQVRQER